MRVFVCVSGGRSPQEKQTSLGLGFLIKRTSPNQVCRLCPNQLFKPCSFKQWPCDGGERGCERWLQNHRTEILASGVLQKDSGTCGLAKKAHIAMIAAIPLGSPTTLILVIGLHPTLENLILSFQTHPLQQGTAFVS